MVSRLLRTAGVRNPGCFYFKSRRSGGMDGKMVSQLSGFDQVLDAIPEPVILLRNNLIVYRNPAASLLRPELTVGDACPPPLSHALLGGGADTVSAITLDGSGYNVIVSKTSFGEVVVLRANRDAGSSNRWLPYFSEQLREHMAGILGAMQQLEEDLRETEGRPHDKWLAILNHSAYRLLRVANMVELRYSLTQDEAMHSGTLDLAGLCESLSGEIRPLAKQTGLTFLYESQVTTLLTLGDVGLLRRMLLALISNAMKAARPGGSIGLRLTKRGERALLTVWDDGPGMDERNLSALFQFERADVVPRPGEGLRLGLLNARTIAELHGGVLVVESKQGNGSRVTVSLPVKQPVGLPLRTPTLSLEDRSGFSSLLVELADALPWQVFQPSELD